MTAQEQKELEHDDLLIQGINLCIILSFNRARKALRLTLKLDPNDALAWLWISRTFDKIKNIQLALAQAYKLNPKHPEIKKELEKVNSAPSSPDEQVKRCPFCFAPMDKTKSQCYFCHSYGIINSSTLSEMCGVGDRHQLFRAVGRFYSLKEHKQHGTILFYSGLATLNMGDQTKALEYFQQLQLKLRADSSFREGVELAIDSIESGRLSTKNMPESKHTPDEDTTANKTGKKMVLVVEDSRMIRKAIVKTLEEHGLAVTQAVDGVEALENLYEIRPDLVLLDIVLPRLDGYYVLSVIKEKQKYKNIPVIILTSRDSVTDKIKGHFSKADAYLTKPFEPQQLIDHVNKHIRQ